MSNHFPLALRLSVTSRCQLRCQYCRPEAENDSCSTASELSFDDLLVFVKFLQNEYGLQNVRITGGEPLLRKDLPELVEKLSALGVQEISLTTNALLLAKVAADLKKAGLARLNISLDSVRPEKFEKITRGGKLEKVFEGIEAAQHAGLTPLKMNVTVMKGVNDTEAVALAEYGLSQACEVRFLELMPIGIVSDKRDLMVPSSESRKQIEEAFHLSPLPMGPTDTSRNFTARHKSKNLEGIIGFISPMSNPFCAGCNRLRLTSDGRLYGCLSQPDFIDLKPLILNHTEADTYRFIEAVEESLKLKRKEERYTSQGLMVNIGG